MTGSKQNVLVVGFGAVGAATAYVAKKSGIASVTVVARSNYEIVKENGMNINSERYGHQRGWRPNRLFKTVAEAADRAYTYVLVVTKCIPDVLKTSTLLEPLLRTSYTDRFDLPTFVLVQNGLGIEVDLYEAIKIKNKRPSIISVAIYILANQVAPNVIQHGAREEYVCGFYRANDFTTTENSPEELYVLEGFREIMIKGGSTVEIVPEIQRRKYRKNLYNVVLAAINLLTRLPLTAVFRPPPSESQNYEPYYFPGTHSLMEEHTISTIRNMAKEVISFGRVLGFPNSEDGVPDEFEEELVTFVTDTYSAPASFHISSTLLDLQRDSPMEIEVIWGSVVRLARQRGVVLPRVEMAYSMLLVVQNQILRRKSETANGKV